MAATMNEQCAIVYSDDRGVNLLALPNGEKIPYIKATRVKQDVDDMRGGICQVFVLMYARLATPDEARALIDKNKRDGGGKHGEGGV